MSKKFKVGDKIIVTSIAHSNDMPVGTIMTIDKIVREYSGESDIITKEHSELYYTEEQIELLEIYDSPLNKMLNEEKE